MAFALSATPTAGVGTISITKDTLVVTGVGTNFTSPALTGRIILVNGFNSRVASVQSATQLTLARMPTQSLTGEAFTHAANGLAVNQTGADTNLSGLSAIEGIGKSITGNQTVYHMGAIKLVYSGAAATASFNALTECLAWDSSTATEVTINAGRTVTVTGQRTDGTYTDAFYPRAFGWPRNGSDFLPGDSPLTNNGIFNATGIWFDLSSAEQITGTANITNCKWTNTLKTANLRLNSANISIDGLALHGSNLTLIAVPAKLDGLKFFNSTYVPVSLPATTEAAPRTYENWDFQGALPLFNNFGSSANYTEFVNLGNWDGFRVASNANTPMPSRFTKRVAVTVSDAAGAAISDAVVYRLDTNNGNRGTFYTADEHFIQSTVAGAASGKILAQVGRFPAGAVYNSTVYTAVMDYRNVANNGTGNDTIYFASYGHLLSERAINTKGNGTLSVAQTVFDDTNTTLSRAEAIAKLASSFTVDSTTKVVTVTANSSYDDLYDAMKAHKCTANAVNLATPARGNALIVTPNSTTLTGYTGWTLAVANGVTLSAGVKFDKVGFPTVTITGTGKITGLYGTSAGDSSTLRLQGVSATGVAAIWHPTTSATELFQTNNSGSVASFEIYYPPGSVGLVKNYARELYGSQRVEGSITLAAGLNTVSFVDIPDVGITEPVLATANAYTTIEGPSKRYDRTAAFRLTEQGIKLGQIATRSGTSIEGTFSVKVRDDAAAVYSVLGNVITIKAASYDADAKFIKEIVTGGGTFTAFDTELIGIDVEDANGDSSVNVQGTVGGLVDVWKCVNGTINADYATGTKIASNISAGKFRFTGSSGFKLIFYDKSSLLARDCSMSKGNYVLGWYVYDQATGGLTQSQNTDFATMVSKVNDIFADVNSVTAGFAESTDSLHAIRTAMDTKPTLAEITASTLNANIVQVNAVPVSGTGAEGDEWGPSA